MGRLHVRRSRGGAERQHGQIVILFALMLVLLMGLAAIVVDVGVLRRSGAELAAAVDSGALAGGAQLPANSSNVTVITNDAVKYLNLNYSGLGATSSWVSYVCLVEYDSASNGPTLSQIPSFCQPGSPANGSTSSAYWRCNTSVCTTPCVPTASGNSCNVIVVGGAVTSDYKFGPAMGIGSGSTGTVQSAACRGTCGGPPIAPVDVALVLDRTQSMSGADTTNAKAAANALVSLYSPSNQWLALGTLGPSRTGQSCAAAPDSAIGTANAPSDLRRWVPVGLSGTGAATNQTYTAVSNSISCYTNSSTGTDLADPVTMAAYELAHNGRAGVTKGIILETDGQPNASVSGNSNYCLQADQAATAAKAAGVEVFTIGFGLDGSNDPNCPDGSGVWKGKKASALLASMSTQPTLGTTTCTAAENADGDHFFCQPKSSDLTSVFQVVATTLAGGAHLIALP